MDLKETDILGDSIDDHWYYCCKAAATRRLLGDMPIRRILDVGAGSGFFSHHLLTHTDAHEAWCVDISYPADSSATSAGKPVHYRRSIDSIDADLVLLMDVLEHVDDDLGLLKSYVDKVPS
ncbi:class I SAM-dependent methyltransferase, partial [Pseudomonas sp. R62]